MDAHEAIIEKLLVLLRAEFGDDLLGVLVTGSRIHGTPDPTSDLDAHVLIGAARRQRRNIVIDGMEVELFINPPFQVRRYFDDGRGIDQHMFTFGRVAYDPHGAVAALQEEARVLWDAGASPEDERLIWQHRYHAADALRDIEDIGAGDPATANMLIVSAVELLIATHYGLARRWPAKPKRRLADLARWDAAAAQLARTALECRPLAERTQALASLAGHVLAPVGGLMPLEWSIEWEQLEA